MDTTIQPRDPKEQLIPMFRAENPNEQTDTRARSGFGNGFACYTCHGQFAPHAQLFVRFDQTGMWRSDATGIQDPNGELGRSTAGLMASHRSNAQQAASEASQILGQPVANLQEAAETLAKHPVFISCMVTQVLEEIMVVAKTSQHQSLVDDLSNTIRQTSADPTLADIVRTVFSDRRVISSALQPTQKGTP